MLRRFCLVLLLSVFAGCGVYRMPDSDEVRVVPNTNNPQVIGIQDTNWEPSVSY